MFSEEELQSETEGFDRGAAIDGNGLRIDFSSIQKSRMEKKERARRRCQRKLFRQQNGSNNRQRPRIARTFEYAKDVRKDVAHKATPLQKKAFDLLDDPVDGKGISQISRTRQYRGLFSISVCRKLGLMLTRWF